MRKILSLLMAVMFTMSLWAEVGDLYYTFVPQKPSSGAVSDYTKTGNQTVDEMTWTVPGNWYATGALRIGGKSISNVDRTITGQTAMGDAISQIVITHQGVTSDNLKLNSVKVTVASDANFANDVETVTLTSGTDFTYAKNTSGTITFTPADGFWAKDSYYKFDFNVSNSNGSNYAWVLNKIEFYSYEGSEPEPTTMDLYLTLSSDWAGWPAKYAVYYFKSADNADNGWSEFMDEVEGETNMYSTTIPLGYDKIIFVRLDGDATETVWASKWSQTADLDTPTDGKTHFTVTSGGTGDECNGAWSEYVPAKPAEDITFYLVNKQGWEAPKAFVFNATASEEDWPGKAMTKTENTVNGFDVYSYTFKDNFTSIIFNNGAATGTIQTADLAWDATKPYFVPGKVNGEGKFEGTWYASLEAIPAPVYNIAGAFTGWKPYALNVANDKNTATLDVQLPAGEYEFKVVRIEGTDTTWFTKTNDGAYGLHREYVGVAGVNEQADNNLKVTADEAGAYLFTWTFANDSVGITFPAKHVLNETWSVDDKTAVAAETQYVDNYAINIKSVYGTTLKENARTFGGFAFSHVIQVRTNGYPSATNLVGAEQSGSTSLVITAKEDVEITMYYNRQVVSGAGTENDNKDIIVVDQAAPTTKLTGAFKIVEILSGNSYLNATKTLSLTKGHVYTVTASGTTLQLSGIRYATDAVEPAATYYISGIGGWDQKQIKATADEYVFENLKADTVYTFKVLPEGLWEGGTILGFEELTTKPQGVFADNDGNVCFKLAEAGDVTVTYKKENEEVTFTVAGNFYVPVPHYYLVGSMNNWKIGDNEFIAGNEDTLSLEMTLFGDYNYQFKVVYVLDEDTTWFGNTEAATMERGNSTGWWLGNDEFHAANVGLLTTNAGKYTFIFKNNENREISVVIPEGGTVVPETKVAMLEGMFSIAKDAKAQFGRGNLVYNYGAQQWYFAEKQYDVLADANLRFGDENYRGSVDLLDWSCENSQYGLLPSNKDADFGDCAFVEWGNLFADESGKSEWSTLSTAEWNYLMARKDAENNKLWTTIGLIPAAASEDTLCGLVLFPDNWVAPAGISFAYGFYDITNDAELKANTLTYAEWATMEAAGAVFLPMGGSRAGHIGNNIGYDGKTETTTVNPETGWYCWVDNVGWYGYYWLSTPDARETHQHCANYVIFPGWNEGPTTADDDDIYLAPQVWSREKRRGNSVRLVHKTYDPHYYLAGDMTNWKESMVELLPLEEKADSLGANVNLEADSLYLYKIVRVQGADSIWYGVVVDVEHGATWEPMTYGNSTNWYVNPNAGDNVGLLTTKEGEYPFILKVAEDHLEVSVTIPAPTPTAAVTGSMNNWEGQIPFELAEDEKTATLFVDNMKSGEYDFRMIIGGQERSNGWWFKRDVLGAAGITGNDENAMKLIADVDGDYTITWFFANDSIHFEFPAPAMFYVTGDSALVKDAAGLEKKDEWKAKAIKAEQDTLVLSLKADQEYKLKLIEDGNWEGGKVYGYDALTQEDKAGLSADNDNNIVFKLNEDGDVKVVYFWEEDTENNEWKMTFKLIGDFYVEPEIPHTYTVVGPSLPNKWDETSTASDMTLVEGVYTYVLADVELKAGAHEYKIVEDHAWDVAFPQDGNASFSVEKDGIYDVTFTLDKETKAYTAVPELKQEIIIAPTAVLMGLAEVEPWTVGEPMEVAEGFKTASITKHFVPSKAEGDTLKFKVVINDAWRSNAYLYHRGFVGADGITMNIEGDDCDMKVVVDVEGDYTFTWTFENDSIGITFPEKPEPVMDDGYYIIGLNGWNVADLTADDMFWSTGIETNEFSINLTLRLNDEFKVVRVVDDVIQEWYPAEGDNYVVDDHHYGATTVYFRPNYNGNEDWFAGCIYVLPTSTVDIDNLDTNAPAVKILRDGQILIIKGTKTFNIQGQLVK